MVSAILETEVRVSSRPLWEKSTTKTTTTITTETTGLRVYLHTQALTLHIQVQGFNIHCFQNKQKQKQQPSNKTPNKQANAIQTSKQIST